MDRLSITKISNISADCTSVDPALKIVVENSELPATHGSEVLFKCPRNHVKKDLNTKAHCEEGEIKFSPGDPGVSSCTKIGRVKSVLK